MKYDYDLFTIGAGSGGVRASRIAAARGVKVGIAEEGRLGGTCVNVGCVPKKLLVYASRISGQVQHASGFGWSIEPPTFDWATLIRNKDTEIRRLNKIYGRLLVGAGCELFRGRARLLDPHRVEIALTDGSVKMVSADRILVATGGAPRRPTEPGTEGALVSDDVFSLESMPERLLVVGGGYIAFEMACIFVGLGARVSLAYRGSLPLRGFDDDVRSFFLSELRKSGIEVHLNTTVDCLTDTEDGAVAAMLSHGEEIDVDAALYAIGRTPNTAGLGLREAGVALNDKGAIIVDDTYRTNVDNIFALGDVTDRLNLTPVAIAEAMSFVDREFQDGDRRVLYDFTPTAVFSDPPIATVGLTEGQAREAHGELHLYTSEFKPLKNTISGSAARTFMKLVVDPATDVVLGVHIVGEDAAEMIQGFAVALRCGATKAQLDSTVGLHPTSAEELVTMRERRPD